MADKKDKKDEAEEKKDGEAAEGAEGAEGEGAKSGGKKKLILFIVLPLVLLIAGGAGAYFTGALDGLLGKKVVECPPDEHGTVPETCPELEAAKAAEEGEHGKDGAEGEGGGEHGEGAKQSAFFEIPNLLVNLNSTSKQPRFLKISVKLELEDPADMPKIEQVMPRVVDHFQTYLRELRVEDLRGSAGLYRLKLELLSRVQAAAPGINVRDVLFQEILIQ